MHARFPDTRIRSAGRVPAVIAVVLLVICSPAQAADPTDKQTLPRGSPSAPEASSIPAASTSPIVDPESGLMNRLKALIEDLKDVDADAEGCLYG